MSLRIFGVASMLLVVVSFAAGQLPGELKGHNGFVHHVAISPDGKLMATASLDGTVKLWDAKTGKELKTLKGHAGQVYCVAFNHDGTLLASSGHDKSIRLWNVKDGKTVKQLQGHTESVDWVAFSPSGKVLASCGADKSVRLWSADAGKTIKSFNTHKDNVYCVAWSPNGKLLASASNDATIKIWDAEAMEETHSLAIKGSKDGVLQVTFAPDSKTLYACGFDKHLYAWDAAKGTELKKLGPAPDPLYGLAVSKDGKTVATASYGGELRLWDTKSGKYKSLQLREGKVDGVVTYCLAFTPDGKALVTGHEVNNAVRVTALDKFKAGQ
ncbi:MAG TPA: WD40 repeat domain-containing protein [Gemmataceae bacterium]|nr:WD40 repeat domain-containing protein [Gemmataceae bacterium]